MANNRQSGESEAKLIEEGRLFSAFTRALDGKDPIAARDTFEAFCIASGFDPKPLLPSHGWEHLR